MYQSGRRQFLFSDSYEGDSYEDPQENSLLNCTSKKIVAELQQHQKIQQQQIKKIPGK